MAGVMVVFEFKLDPEAERQKVDAVWAMCWHGIHAQPDLVPRRVQLVAVGVGDPGVHRVTYEFAILAKLGEPDDTAQYLGSFRTLGELRHVFVRAV